MIPFAVAFFGKGGDTGPVIEPETPPVITTDLVLEDLTNSSNRTYTFSPGEEYASRVFMIFWTTYRNNTTGAVTIGSVTLDGAALRYEERATTVRANSYWAMVYAPTGTADRSLNIQTTNGSISSVRIVRIGSATDPLKLRQRFSIGTYGTVGLQQSLTLNSSSRLLVQSLRTITDGLPLLDQAGSVVLGTEDIFSVEGDGRQVKNSVLSLSPSDSSIVEATQQASATNLHKAMQGIVATPKLSDELIYLPREDVLYYHMRASKDAFSDLTGTTACADGDGVALWGNAGSSGDLQQTTLLRRPVYRTGGANGFPYLNCNKVSQHWFEDLLDIPQVGGSTTANPYTLAGVIHVDDLDALQPLLGATSQKGRFVVTTAGAFQLMKPQFTFLTGAVSASGPIAFAISLDSFEYVRGIAGTTEATFQNTSNASGTTTSAVQVFRSTVDAAFFNGKIYELLYWRASLGTNERQRVCQALSLKYGLAI